MLICSWCRLYGLLNTLNYVLILAGPILVALAGFSTYAAMVRATFVTRFSALLICRDEASRLCRAWHDSQHVDLSRTHGCACAGPQGRVDGDPVMAGLRAAGIDSVPSAGAVQPAARPHPAAAGLHHVAHQRPHRRAAPAGLPPRELRRLLQTRFWSSSSRCKLAAQHVATRFRH